MQLHTFVFTYINIISVKFFQKKNQKLFNIANLTWVSWFGDTVWSFTYLKYFEIYTIKQTQLITKHFLRKIDCHSLN